MCLNNTLTIFFRGSVILVVSNDTEFESTGMQNENLNENLRFVVPGNFYLAAEYTGVSIIETLFTGQLCQ